jgi:hypothetical protein
MANRTEFPWRTMAPRVRQFMGERLRDTPPFFYKRLSLLSAVGLGAGCFGLLLVLWWLISPPQVPGPPTTGIDLHEMLSALQTVLADPTLGSLSPGTSAPFALKNVDVEVHFVVQQSAPASGAPLYRLVPVDTALQTRPEHVQTLTLRLTATAPPSPTLGTPEASPAVPQAAEEGGLLKPPPPKKRARP